MMHNPEGYWPRGNGACGKPDTYQSGNGILGRTHDPTILRLSVCLSVCLSVSLSLFYDRRLCAFLFPQRASYSCISVWSVSDSPSLRVSTLTRGRVHTVIEYSLSSAWNFNANQLWCLIEWRILWSLSGP